MEAPPSESAVPTVREGAISIACLPPNLLASILRHVPIGDRLRCCAVVCHAWHKAAVAATDSISKEDCCPATLAALSGWLAAPDRAVTNITLAAVVHEPPLDPFDLPSQQLPGLRELDLSFLWVRSCSRDLAGTAPQEQQQEPVLEQPAAGPQLTRELWGLTRLSLANNRFDLQGVQSLKQLASLSLGHNVYYPMGPDQHRDSNLAHLEAALQTNTHITSLQLQGPYCTEALVTACATLQALQSLHLAGAVPVKALAGLPLTLTRLQLEHWANDRETEEQRPPLSLTAATAPRLAQLTALQALSVQYAGTFHPVLLANMHQLRELFVWADLVGWDFAEPSLEILTRLQNLEDLHLVWKDPSPALAAPSDVAALTSSSHLTRLNAMDIPPVHMRALFPAGCSLPHLQQLSLNEHFLLQHEVLARAVVSCPQLTYLKLHVLEHPEAPPAQPQVDRMAVGLQLLAGFAQLQHVEIGWVPVSAAGWGALAALPSLRHLSVSDEPLSTLQGVVAMTACRSLTRLEVEVYPPDYASRFAIAVDSKAPEGSPPDVRCRLPTAVINSALELVTHRPEGPDDTLLDMYRSLTSAATASLGTMQVEQQHEVAGLRQRTAALEAAQAQQQQQTGALQQQVQDMQAALQQLLQQQQGGRQ